jgi:hypothetical protein
MARILATGFEAGSTGVFDLQVPAASLSTTVTRGAWSSYSSTGGGTTGVISFASSVGELYVGCGFYGSDASALAVFHIVSQNNTPNLTLTTDGANHFQIRRGDASGTVLATSSLTYSASRWYFVEVYTLTDDATGKYQLKVDGVDWIALATGADTRNDAAANGNLNNRLYNVNTGSGFIDDLYVNDTTGSQNTGFSGDIRISAYIPNASGDVTGMTPTSGSNYTNVDERPPNDATDIVAATGTTLYDLYNIPNTSGVATVQSVTLWLRAQKSDAGAKSIAHMIKSASTENQGADLALSTSWSYYRKVYSNDPTDSNAWTPGKVDALQVGQKAR